MKITIDGTSGIKKIEHIDSIRGIAILMVIFVHIAHTISMVSKLNPILFLVTEYGQLGVLLFYVVSAYTLCLSAESRENEKNKNLKFFIRRYFRIAPAYYIIGIGGYFILAYLVPNYSVLKFENYTPLNICANLFFVHGFVQNTANNGIVPGGWSIGTEMAFYALFPILLYYTKKASNINFKYIFVAFFLIVTATQLVSFMLFKDKINMNSFVYFNLYNQLPVFYLGIAYYFLEKQNFFNYDIKFDFLHFLWLTTLSLGIWGVSLKLNKGYLFTIIPIVSALSFIFLINIFKKSSNLNIPILKRIGVLSYSMYLIHFFFARSVSLFILSKAKQELNQVLVLIVLFGFSVVASYFIAILSEKYIEKRFIRIGKAITENI